MKVRQPDDLMDQLAHWLATHIAPLGKLEPVYRKHKQFLLYASFGAGTLFISIFSYWVFTEVFKWNILAGNAVSWIFATSFSFYTTRKWVFKGHRRGVYAFFIQLSGFFFGRFLTLFIEEWMLFFLVGMLNWPNMPVKFAATVVVITLNYIFSKLVVFRKKAK